MMEIMKNIKNVVMEIGAFLVLIIGVALFISGILYIVLLWRQFQIVALLKLGVTLPDHSLRIILLFLLVGYYLSIVSCVLMEKASQKRSELDRKNNQSELESRIGKGD